MVVLRLQSRLLALCLMATLALAGCDTMRLPGGETATALPAPQAPRLTGVPGRSDGDHQKLVAAFGGEYSAPAMEKLLDAIATKLVAASSDPSRSYHVTILNSPLSLNGARRLPAVLHPRFCRVAQLAMSLPPRDSSASRDFRARKNSKRMKRASR